MTECSNQNSRLRYVLTVLIVAVLVVSGSCSLVRNAQALSQESQSVSSSDITPVVRNPSEPLGVGWVMGTAYGDSIWQGNPDDTWTKTDIYSTMTNEGFNWFRLGVTDLSYPELENMTLSNHPAVYENGYYVSMQWDLNIFRKAQAAGMNLDLFFDLSTGQTAGGNQKAPASWANYTLAQTASALENMTYNTTEYYRQKGVNITLYDIGNEIDLGIAGYSFDTKLYTPGIDVLHDTTWDAQNIWSKEACLLNASIAGVKAADPSAKVVLHISLSQYPAFVLAFFETMNGYHVPYDYGGLSYYAWSNPHPYTGEPDAYQFLSQDIGIISGLGKGVIISEYSFPNSDPSTNAAFGPPSWTVPVPGYPFTPQGQFNWARSFVTNMSEDRRVDMVFYFYPDAYDIDPQTALFYNDTTSMPALGAFANLPPATSITTTTTVSTTTRSSLSSTQTGTSSFAPLSTNNPSSSSEGVPEFPFQTLLAVVVPMVIVLAYLAIRQRLADK